MLAATGCGSTGNSGGNDNSSSGGNTTDGGTSNTTDGGSAPSGDQEISVCLASEPATLDPALNSAVDGATLCAHLFTGLAKWDKDSDGSPVIVPGIATELPEGVKNGDGTVTYTYTIRDDAKWSDGKPVTANDFVFSWNRACSTTLAADYGYMLEVVKGYSDMWEMNDDGETYKNPDAKLAVTAKDDHTLEVTLTNEVSYWNELLAFPSYYPVREDVVSNESWATDPKTFVCNGAYTIDSWDHNSVITLKKNPEYCESDKITMDTINFYLSDDANNMLTNFKNGSWQLIDDIPTNEIASLKSEYPDNFVVNGQLGTYYVCWNVNYDLLPNSSLTGAEKERAEEEVRRALALVIDRNYIVESVAQGGQVPASSFVAMGLTDADGSQFYKNAGDSDLYDGYYNVNADAYQNNWEQAIEILKKYYTYDGTKFTDMPSMTYLYNTSEGHKAIAENIQGIYANIGANMTLENQEWATFLETRKNGDFTVARNGWLADYNDPISFLDMWTSASGNNDVQFGKGANADLKAYSIDTTDVGGDLKVDNGTWAETYDVLISKIKSCTDKDLRYKLMHKAEDLLMSTGCITPIYYYTDLFMIDSSVKGFFSNPLGYKYFMYCTVS